MTPEEKFMFDLDGYLVIKDVLSREELDVLNAVADRAFPRDYGDVEADGEFGNARGVRRAPSIVNWDVACRDLIDHPNVLPYLVDLLGPKFRLDHDYAIFMMKNGKRGSLHGGKPDLFHHYYRYRDGVMQCGLSVLTYVLSDADAGDGGFACVRAVTRAISGWICRAMCSGLIGFRTMLCSPRQRRGMRFFLQRLWYTVHCHGGQITSAGCCFTNTARGI